MHQVGMVRRKSVKRTKHLSTDTIIKKLIKKRAWRARRVTLRLLV